MLLRDTPAGASAGNGVCRRPPPNKSAQPPTSAPTAMVAGRGCDALTPPPTRGARLCPPSP